MSLRRRPNSGTANQRANSVFPVPVAGEEYVEPNMQIQQVKHRSNDSSLKKLVEAGIEGGKKLDEVTTEKFRQYKETHTPEAQLANEQAKLQLMEAQQRMDEERALIQQRKQQLIQEREQAKEEAKQKTVEEGGGISA